MRLKEMVISKNFRGYSRYINSPFHASLTIIKKREKETENEKRCKCWVKTEKYSSVLIKVNELATKKLSMPGFFFHVVTAFLAIRLQYLDMTATFLTQDLNIYNI